MHSRTRVKVRFAETDQLGIVHHSNYPVWYEIGRNDYINMLDLCYDDMKKAGIVTPVLNLTTHFDLPAFYEDELIIRTKVLMISASRITFTYSVKRIEKDSGETELGYGTTEHAFVDINTLRPCNVRKRMPELYNKISATF